MEDVELPTLCDIRSERLSPYPDKHRYFDCDDMLENELWISVCLLICMQSMP